ncbi:MAG: hypothetical protein ALECFALPRED_009172 [Alectoria fallacina]|uniref:Uncharacterized protein n=1 Tax=Alectoria fallacina TaxID=1903189 RepID=A0A8H3J6G5_9LECA|nr:MAG: hypothetical protein ALECFALPRED_009172 [Alectoria fallacina]
MNTSTRKKYFSLKPEDWISHGYADPLRDRPVGSKLTNDVHPMFSYELDESPGGGTTKARWGQLTMKEYELFDQPLRLATQLLESAPSADAICSIVYGNRYIPQDNLMHKGLAVFEFSQHSLSPPVMQERAGNVLKELGKSISFRVTDRDANMSLAGGDRGRTSPILPPYPDGVAITDRPELKGLASITLIQHEYLTTLEKLLPDSKGNHSKIRKLYFEFALTICHEVIHAINFAIESEFLKKYIEMGQNFTRVAFNEPIHEDQRVAELGYFWENEVFGGACAQTVVNTQDPLFLVDWPSWLNRDKESDPERALPRKLCYRYLVPTYYIQNIQTQEFWDTVKLEHSQDLLALRMRKTVALAAWYQEDDIDPTWDWKAPENLPKTVGKNPIRVLNDYADPSPCTRLLYETAKESIAKAAQSDPLEAADPGASA